MAVTYDSDYTTQVRLLFAEFRQFCRAVSLYSTAGTIHRLRNYQGTALAALTLIEVRVAQGDLDDCGLLLELATTCLRDGRALIARTSAPASSGVQREVT